MKTRKRNIGGFEITSMYYKDRKYCAIAHNREGALMLGLGVEGCDSHEEAITECAYALGMFRGRVLEREGK